MLLFLYDRIISGLKAEHRTYCSIPASWFNAFALTGHNFSNTITQGVASLALGYVLHWAFSPPLLNPIHK